MLNTIVTKEDYLEVNITGLLKIFAKKVRHHRSPHFFGTTTSFFVVPV